MQRSLSLPSELRIKNPDGLEAEGLGEGEEGQGVDAGREDREGREDEEGMEIDDEDDDDDGDGDGSNGKTGNLNDEDDEDVVPQRSKTDPNYSPRKACAEEVAIFRRASSLTEQGAEGAASPTGASLLKTVDAGDAGPSAAAASAATGGASGSASAGAGETTKGAENGLTIKIDDGSAPSSLGLEADYIEIRQFILEGRLADVKKLVEGIADDKRRLDLLNHVSGKDGFSPLMIAVSCDEDKADIPLLQFLIDNGAKLDVKDSKGNTCLHWAAVHGQSGAIKLLVKDKEEIGVQNKRGDTPLHLAARSGRVKCCEILLRYFNPAIQSRPVPTVSSAAEAVQAAMAAKKEEEEEDSSKNGDENGSELGEANKPKKTKEAEATAVKEEKEDPEDAAAAAAAAAKGDKAMQDLLAKRNKERQRLERSEKRKRLQKELEGRVEETKANEETPHPILVLRNCEQEAAFEVAGTEVSLSNIGTGTPAMVKMKKARYTQDVRRAIHQLFYDTCGFFKTLVLHHPDCFDHLPYGEEGRDIWEAPERLMAIMNSVVDKCDKKAITVSSKFECATRAMLERAHSREYVDLVFGLEKTVTDVPVPFTPQVQRRVMNVEEKNLKKAEHCDTSFSPGSLKAALRACGSVCYAIDRVTQQLQRNAFCVVRPPGHHVGIDGLLESATSCGFCILNNVMVGALHAMETYPDKIKRVAIVDFDVHHGNGTEEIVAKLNRETMQEQAARGEAPQPPILFFSSHVFDAARPGSSYEFYPGSGQFSDSMGNVINAPMQPLWRRRGYRKNVDGRRSWAERYYFDHFGRTEFRRIVKERLLPPLRAFKPDLVLISAGFDASRRDVGNGRFMGKYCNGFDLQQQDFMWIAGQISRVASVCCDGRVVSVLEGGYGRLVNRNGAQNSFSIDRSFLARNCVAHLGGLVDPLAKMDEDSSESDDSDDEKTALSRDTEEKLSSRRARTRRPPKRFEGQEQERGKRRRGAKADSSGESDENGARLKRRRDEDARDDDRMQSRRRNKAVVYLGHVKAEFSDRPEVYKEFLALMGRFKTGRVGVNHVIVMVKQLFAGNRDLIEGFATFLPAGFSIRYDEPAGDASATSAARAANV